MKYLLILNYLYLIIALYGCSTVDNATEQSYTETHVAANGVTLLPSSKMWVSFEQVANIYDETMACVGLHAPGPDVQFKSFTDWYLGGSWGLYHPGGLVMINTDEKDQYAGFPARDEQTDTEVLRHEYIHHILHENDIPWHDGESSDIFKRCGAGVTIAN